MQVARQYGMIMPGEDSTKAVRAVFVVDPKCVVRAIIYYPLSLGRNFDELLRVIKALQTADHFEVATPADWRPGDPVIVPPRAPAARLRSGCPDRTPGCTVRTGSSAPGRFPPRRSSRPFERRRALMQVLEVDPAGALRLVEVSGAVLLDVREDDEWAAGHAPVRSMCAWGPGSAGS